MSIWVTNCADYPDFVGSDCMVPVNCGVVGEAVNEVTGLDHLEGMTVAILADGIVLPQQIVVDGAITLDGYYAKVHVGLPYISDFETLNIEVGLRDGTMQGKKVKIGNVTFRLEDTRGGWVGPDEDTLYDAFNAAIINKLGDDDPLLLFTGDIRMPLGAGYEDGGRVFVRQYDPTSITILAAIPETSPGGPTE